MDVTSFIEDPDGGSVLYGQCDLFDQDCPMEEKCVPWANDGGTVWNATRCVPVADDPAGPGEPCTIEESPTSGIDDCDASSMCFYVDPDTEMGTCVSFCGGSWDNPTCPDAEDSCMIANDRVLSLCLEPCDPLAETCPAGQHCAFARDDFFCLEDGAAELGEDCTYAMDCAAGLSCAPTPFADCLSCCTEPCDPDAPACSDVAQVCAPAGDAGLCVLPDP